MTGRHGNRAYIWNRTVTIVIALLLAGGLYFMARGYYSRYYYVAARWGDKSVTEYERLLRKSVHLDSGYGRSNQELARVMISRKKYEDALHLQERAMLSYRPVSAYEQLGIIHERLQEGQTSGTNSGSGDASLSREYYEKTLRMFPLKVSTLERLANQALVNGDAEKLQELTAAIVRIDPQNLNGIYFEAVAAERAGNPSAALVKYQRISAAGIAPRGAIFTMDQVAGRIRALRSMVR